MRRTMALTAAVIFSLIFISCGDDEGGDVCTAKATASCSCTGGGTGTKTCSSDGKSWGACTGCAATKDGGTDGAGGDGSLSDGKAKDGVSPEGGSPDGPRPDKTQVDMGPPDAFVDGLLQRAVTLDHD